MELFVPSKIKVHSLTGRITPEVVLAAFKAVKRNRSAAGIDRVSIDLFAANLQDNLNSVLRDLKDGSFEPKPLRRQFIDKGNGQLRPLGIVGQHRPQSSGLDAPPTRLPLHALRR